MTEIARHGSHSATIKIDTGTDVAVDILFAHPRTRPSVSLHDALGLATVNTPTGNALKTDERRETSMPGIYAAGNLANPGIPSVITATWQGAMAGSGDRITLDEIATALQKVPGICVQDITRPCPDQQD